MLFRQSLLIAQVCANVIHYISKKIRHMFSLSSVIFIILLSFISYNVSLTFIYAGHYLLQVSLFLLRNSQYICSNKRCRSSFEVIIRLLFNETVKKYLLSFSNIATFSISSQLKCSIRQLLFVCGISLHEH